MLLTFPLLRLNMFGQFVPPNELSQFALYNSANGRLPPVVYSKQLIINSN